MSHTHHRTVALIALGLLISSGMAVSWQSRAQTLKSKDCLEENNQLRSSAKNGQITSIYHVFYSPKTRSCLVSYYVYFAGSNAEDQGEKIGIDDVATGKEQWSQALQTWISVPEAAAILDKKEAALHS
ncbi:hypothetical protein HY627_00315 [Candidatus Uhrbacteria bacterium]|nr:hypothetical protein [Candidatus Uhrbacteria bacterium]